MTAFKASTKLSDLIGWSVSVPDYCIELTLEVKGWEDKTIKDAERAAMNILQVQQSDHWMEDGDHWKLKADVHSHAAHQS